MKLKAVAAALLFAAACSGSNGAPSVPQERIVTAASEIVSYPLALDPGCRDGRAIAYDECSDQLGLFQDALARANEEGKALLVIVGAEWCGWCRSFDAHLKGATGRFDRLTKNRRGDVSKPALELVSYAAENFVIVHIDGDHAPGTEKVIASAEAGDYFQGFYPTIFSVSPEGRFAAKLDHPYVKIQKGIPVPYQGYNRRLVIEELKRLHTAARGT